MAIDIVADGVPIWNASDYSVAEDSTPVDPSDTTGGVGQFSITIPENDRARLLRNREITLSDGAQGTTMGIARGMSGDGSNAQVVVDSRLAALMVTRMAQPYSGTLDGLFRYYLYLAGITTNIVVDPSVANRTITTPGWNDIVWDRIKALTAALQVEVSLVSNNIVLRPLRTRIAQNHRDTDQSWSVNADNVAQSVEVYYYQSTTRSGLAYPLGGWNSDVQAYQVDAGATVSFDIALEPDDTSTLGVSLFSVDQPVCVASVDPTYSTSSVYTVSGNDGLPITPAQWAATGGSLAAKINPDTRSITITITGSRTTQYAPYTIGMSSGDNTYYSSLRLVGNGVYFDRQKLTFLTGHGPDFAPTVVGATVDNSFIRTSEEAFRAGVWALGAYTGPKRTVSVSTAGINRVGESNDLTYMTMGQFNADPDFLGLTMKQFNAANAKQRFSAFNKAQFAKVRDRFENQAFGNVAGARVALNGGMHRIRTVSGIGPAGLSYSADADDTCQDFNSQYQGLTAAQFNALHAGRRVGDFNVVPFITEPMEPLSPSIAPSDLLYPSNSLLPI